MTLFTTKPNNKTYSACWECHFSYKGKSYSYATPVPRRGNSVAHTRAWKHYRRMHRLMLKSIMESAQ